MKFTLATSVLAASAVVVADTVYFSAVDPSTGNQLANIVDMHSMAGGSFWFYGSTPSLYNFDPATNLVTTTIGTNNYQFGTASFGTFAGIFMTNKKTPVTTDAKGKVTVFQFFACDNVNDPYKYSNTRSVIMVNAPGNMTRPARSCKPVDIYKRNYAPAPIPNNGTWTSYTTYCPLPTVVTITSCGTETCYPTAVTVTTATTITCAQCIAPTNTVTAMVAPPVSAAPLSTVTYTGAAGKAAVGAGLVGAAAAMLL